VIQLDQASAQIITKQRQPGEHLLLPTVLPVSFPHVAGYFPTFAFHPDVAEDLTLPPPYFVPSTSARLC